MGIQSVVIASVVTSEMVSAYELVCDGDFLVNRCVGSDAEARQQEGFDPEAFALGSARLGDCLNSGLFMLISGCN